MYYHMNIAGLDRDLPICPVSDSLYIAGFVIFGDQELTVACARELLKRAPEYDYIIAPEAKAIPLLYEMARQSGKPYFIARKYPGARIVDAEREKGNTEVDIIFAGKALEVCFGTGDAWLWTKTGVRLSEVPDVVRRTLQSSQYGTWGIDDVDLYESPDRVWYAIEVEDPQSEREATVRILEDGTLL